MSMALALTRTVNPETRRGSDALARLVPRTADLTRRQFAQISALV